MDVEGGDTPEMKTPLKNPDLSPFTVVVGSLLSDYGWYLLAVTLLLYLLIHHLSKRRSSQPPRSSPPDTHQDPGFVARRQEAMEAARRRMQEEQDAKAAAFKEKQKQQEEERRRQKIEDWENLQQGKSSRGNKLAQGSDQAESSATVMKPKTDKKLLRSSDYNPLSGEGGGSCTWRPGRRGPSSSG